MSIYDHEIAPMEDAMASHTPGPWRVEIRAGDEWYFGGGNDQEFVIRGLKDPEAGGDDPIAVYSADTEEDRANARLISAAPELLEALKEVIKVSDRATVEFDAARAAIAKAEGRS